MSGRSASGLLHGDGCHVHAHCFTCPLATCVYDVNLATQRAEAQRAEAARRYAAGESAEDIARDIGRSKRTVWHYIQQAGIPLRPRHLPLHPDEHVERRRQYLRDFYARRKQRALSALTPAEPARSLGTALPVRSGASAINGPERTARVPLVPRSEPSKQKAVVSATAQ